MRSNSLNLFDAAFLAQSLAAVTPTSFSGLVRWWDADTYDKSDGSLITPDEPWDDKSSSGLDATTTLGREPTFKETILNGKPAVRLVGEKHLAFNGGNLALTDFTILCVGLSTTDSIFLSKNGVNRQIRINRNNEHRASWITESGQELVSNLFMSNAGNPRMFGYRRNDTSDPDKRDFKFYDNANEVDRPLSTTSAALFELDQIGIIDGGPLNIDIGELLIYNRALSTGEIQALYLQYFQPKFTL